MEQVDISLARALVYLTLLPAAGLPFYFITAGRVAPMATAARRATAVLALLAGLASCLWLLASVAAMAGLTIGELDRHTVQVVADATPLGAVLEIRFTALVLLAATVLPRRIPLALPALAGLAALATASFTGHAGASEGTAGVVHRLFDTAHLAAAACWFGALLHFVASAFGPVAAEPFEQRLSRFARTGTIIVAVLFASGMANALLITGWPVPLATLWTRLLLLKFALFGAMLGLAALNRWWLTPALAQGGRNARLDLRASLAVELCCGIALIGVVSLLGTLDPSGM